VYYNGRFKELSGNDILEFADMMSRQRKGIAKYGMVDNRVERGIHDLLATFFCRIFKNTMPLVLEVLTKMRSDYSKERETICHSHGPVDLFRFINEIFDMAKECEDDIVHRGVLGLVFK